MNISHLYQDHKSGKWTIQTNEQHSIGVAELAASFASDFGMQTWGKILGMLHDKGKETIGFQSHIKRESGFDPKAFSTENHQHAYVGGLIAKKLFPKEWPLISNQIMGHHRGLYDKNDFLDLLGKDIPKEVSIPYDIKSTSLTVPRLAQEDVNHMIRMLFSCLVDADYIDTERFMNPESFKKRKTKYNLLELLDILESYLSSLKSCTQDTPVNRVRNFVQETCRKNCYGPVDIYEMTVPTGGGKTLSSILWALKHAVRNNQKRIIIAIPYTSIIEQTALTLKSIFGESNVLEHHSQISFNETEDSELNLKLRLATENWDYPIIVTTNVRLFETIFNHKPSACRRLHNITNSIIILDEVQTLPISLYSPILTALKSLKSVFHTSVLLTTASQPVLCGEIKGCNPLTTVKGFSSSPIAVIPHEKKLWEPLRRVELHFDDYKSSYNDVAIRIDNTKKVLCIVNTRKIAKEIYTRLSDRDNCIHLSRMMCPAHIKSQLKKIRHRLNDPLKPVKVISTQLIEAGVDVDFPIVLRQEAGLDSIIQAAGRCNREGKLDSLGKTFVFSINERNPIPPGLLSKANSARLDMPADSDWFSDKAIGEYFLKLCSRINTFDEYGTLDNLMATRLNFETASKEFKYINDNSQRVVVNWEESMKIVETYKYSGPSYRVLKELGQFSVNISKYDLNSLIEMGMIEEIGNLLVIPDEKAYDNDVGLTLQNHWLDETIII